MSLYLKIGEFASSVGVKTNIVRYWHSKGILVPKIIDGRYRYYSNDQIEDAKKIAKNNCRKKMFLQAKSVIDNNKLLELSDFESYLFGLCCADGSLSGSLLLELKDHDLVNEIAEVCGVCVGKHRENLRVTIPSKIRKKFECFGLCNRKGKNGFIIPLMQESSYRHFIRGFFDGDGCVDVHNGRLRVRITGHIDPLGQIQNTFWDSFGMYFGWSAFKIRNSCGNIECSSIDSTKKFYNIVYGVGGVCLRRKKSVFEEYFQMTK
jgi:hypothetical protein